MNLAKQTTFRALAAAFAIGAVCLLAANHFGALPIPVFGVGDASATEASPEVMDALHAAADAKLAETPGRIRWWIATGPPLSWAHCASTANR